MAEAFVIAVLGAESTGKTTLAQALATRLAQETGLRTAWVPDGHQRDGAHVRAPVDAALREMLITHRLPWALVGGSGTQRVEAALDAVAPALRARRSPRAGLFTRLAQRNASEPAQPWVCERCDDPDCEHLSLR